MDYKNKDINHLNNTTYPKYIFSLLDFDNKEKMKFKVNLLNLSFLGEELYTTSIYYYPILIIEFMNGYYTTTELFKKNDYLINLNSSKKLSADSLDNNFKIDNYTSEAIVNKSKKEQNKNLKNKSERIISSSIMKSQMLPKMIQNSEDRNQTNNLNISNKKENLRSSSFVEIKDSEINKNKEKSNKNKINIKNKVKSEPIEIKETKPNCYTFKEYFNIYKEKIIYFSDRINKITSNENIQIENCDDIIEIYKRKERIHKAKSQIEYYKNKSEEIKKIKEKLQKIISNKKVLLTNLNQKINSYKELSSNLEQSNKQTFPLVIQQQMLYKSFLNKKMSEICFFFFNRKIKGLYFIPDFLKINIENDNESIKKRFEYYNNNKKRISSMMGYITQLMIYMSKCFDIPMPYPLCLNGSKSFVVRGKKDKEKDFLPLHCDLKREDRYGNFETGLNYLKNDFNEIINFCQMFPQIITENDYEKLYKDKEGNFFFYYFINFNHCLLHFVKNIQEMLE